MSVHLDVFGDVDITGAQVAEAGLFDQLTLLVGIRDPHGHAAAARLWAGAPWGSLGDAVPVPAPRVSWESWINVDTEKSLTY